MLLNIFHSGGLWVIPLMCLGGSLYCLYRAYRIHNSGQQLRDDTPGSPTRGQWIDVPGKYPYSKIGVAYFGVALLLAFIITLLVISSDYKGV